MYGSRKYARESEKEEINYSKDRELFPSTDLELVHQKERRRERRAAEGRVPRRKKRENPLEVTYT